MHSITLDKTNSIQLNGCREDLSLARDFVMKTLEKSAFNDRERHLLVLAVDEALSHIVSYSEVISDLHQVRLGIEVDNTRFVARIQDGRTDFSDLLVGSNDDELKRRSNQGQLGIFLIRQIVDEVKYTFHKGFENELVLLKFVSAD